MTTPTAPYTLANAENRARENPETFQIPSRFTREGLMTGDRAKLIFLQAGLSERLWVRVTGRTDDGFRYVGQLLSTPITKTIPKFRSPDVDPGDLIEFGPENIINVLEVNTPEET